MATLYEYYITGDDATQLIDHADDRVAQTFTTTDAYTIGSIALKLLRVGLPGTVTVTIRTTLAGEPTANVVATGTTDGDTLPVTTAEWRTIVFAASANLSATTLYAIVVSAAGATATKKVGVRYDGTAGAYTTAGDTVNRMYISSNAEASWDAGGAGVSAFDVLFENYGGSVFSAATAPVDKRFSKKLVNACNNEIWYGATTADMAELVAAKNDIDTTKPLQMFELYEKVFIVNETNLKVADFGNVKLHTADIEPGGKVPPVHGSVLTATGGSEASMVVDYITALNGATYVYGKRITAATFVSGDVLVDADTTISFTLDADEVLPPHWYDWTVYGGSTTYGIMPTQATLGCPWRGRPCLSGDEDYPHQWYQARQEDPWDWNYVSADVQSPVSGGGDASIPGQVGDIVIAQIPFDRDHLVYGGANSLWVLTGDAAEGGTLNSFYDAGGILGANAWCKDSKDNLYIMSTVGLLKIPQGFGPPENITEFTYPDFIKDLAYNSATYRIVMGYDRKRNGIKITRVTLASGANTGWWYDLKAEALFPESYADACGMFSMFHYEAVDPDYNCLLFGCADGYLRFADPDAVNDAATADTLGSPSTAIDSYITFGPIKLGEENREGKVNSLVGVTSGGASGGSETDSDDVAFKIWTELSADRISERFSANSGQKVSGTIKAPGRWRGNQFRRSIRGMFAGLRIGNSDADETWGLERLLLGIKRAGRMK